MYNILKVLLVSTFWAVVACQTYTPIVLWHGLGNTCCDTYYTGRALKELKEYLPGVHVLSLRIGNSEFEDLINGYIMHPDKQTEIACDILKSDPLLLANGYHAVGFSQGSQLLRGLAQRCPEPRMKKLITLAGQHQGMYGIPLCNATDRPLCDVLRRTVSIGAYSSLLQKYMVPATYWHDPLHENVYKEKSSYLADINNERIINQTYINNLQMLEKFVMVKYTKDHGIQPLESEWFGFYKPGQSKIIHKLQESDLYISDRLGLKQMDIDGKLDFLEAPFYHAEFDWPWFKENIVDVYLV